MPRTVDPERYQARRLQIIDAALTCFAASGYSGTSTAELCRTAGIGSGTFFHYFPTKQSLLLAILDLGTTETREWFAARRAESDPRSVIDAYLAHTVEDYADPRMGGFVRAVGAVMGEPEVEAAITLDTRVHREGLLPWVAAAQTQGQVRTDVSADDLTDWVLLVLDGFLGRLAAGDGFTAQSQAGMLTETVTRLLAP